MSNLVFKGWHEIEEVETLIKGQKVKREILHLKSAVAGIVTDEEGRIALVGQYRPALGQHTLEIPAGVIDKKMSKVEILKEELLEECNIAREDILSVDVAQPTGFNMVSGSSPAYMHLYRVKVKCKKPDMYFVQDADVECVFWMKLEDFEKGFLRGEFTDAKTMFAYYLLKDEMKKKEENKNA